MTSETPAVGTVGLGGTGTNHAGWLSDAGAEMAVGGDDLRVLGTDTDPFDHYTESTFDGGADLTGHPAQDAAFVAAGEPPELGTVAEGLAVQRLIDAIYDAGE
jgi:hypothetical protein